MQRLHDDVIRAGVPFLDPASKLPQLEATDLEAIGRRAYTIWSDTSGQHRPRLDKAICLAIVEHIEGKPRELKRRRHPEKKAKRPNE